MIWPIVLSSSIKVKNDSDTFKPEYIIPQQLLQWVRKNANIDGIAYQTTHIDFPTTLAEGEFVNLVLPVKDIRTRGLCKTLKSKFKMTKATSIQLVHLSTGGTTFIFGDDELLNRRIKKIEIEKGLALPYEYSILGTLERSLNSKALEIIQ